MGSARNSGCAVALSLGLVLTLQLGIPTVASAAEWAQLDIDETSTYARWYRPDGLDDIELPVVVFLHGAGSTPEAWMPLLEDLADDGDFILLLPKSISPFGWGVGQDDTTLELAIAALGQTTPIARQRVGLAGHSSGGAFAYVAGLAGQLHISAIFSLSTPFRTVLEVKDPAYTPPLRLYYGTEDPNYGNVLPLTAMFDRLDVDWQLDVEQGFGHNSWPSTTLGDGFAFLLQHEYPGPCVPSDTRLCLLDGRFAVELTWENFVGETGVGSAVEPRTTDSGLLWFFGEANWELLVKVIDGCGFNGHYWVFAAASTNVEYRLQVTDLLAGTEPVEAVYLNDLGQASAAITDTEAFATCP